MFDHIPYANSWRSIIPKLTNRCHRPSLWLLFWEPAPSSTLELEERDEELGDVAGGDLRDAEEESDVEGFSWDELLIEDEDEETMDWSD